MINSDWPNQEAYLTLAKGLQYRGKPIRDLNQEELLYIIGEYLNLMGQVWILSNKLRLDQFTSLENSDAEIS